MKKEIRSVCFDDALSVEALSFEGVTQTFPEHFHDYYVIGLVLHGERRMVCKRGAFGIKRSDILLLEPFDTHGCVQSDADTLGYIALNISRETMCRVEREITGEASERPHFSKTVAHSIELAALIQRTHSLIFSEANSFEREEAFYMTMECLFENFGEPFLQTIAKSADAERVCDYLNEHYSGRVTLDALCAVGRMSKSTLLRTFAKFKGITPYRYLQSVRINRAKRLLEEGTPPIETAALTGFSDQSHLSNAFHTFFGLSPAAYGKIFEKDGQTNERKMRDNN